MTEPSRAAGSEVAVVALEAEVTGDRVREIGRGLAAAAWREAPAGVVLDLSRVPVVDLDTAEACRELALALRLLGVPTALAGLSPGAAACLALLGFDPHPLRPVRTAEEARRLLPGQGS